MYFSFESLASLGWFCTPKTPSSVMRPPRPLQTCLASARALTLTTPSPSAPRPVLALLLDFGSDPFRPIPPWSLTWFHPAGCPLIYACVMASLEKTCAIVMFTMQIKGCRLPLTFVTRPVLCVAASTPLWLSSLVQLAAWPCLFSRKHQQRHCYVIELSYCGI